MLTQSLLSGSLDPHGCPGICRHTYVFRSWIETLCPLCNPLLQLFGGLPIRLHVFCSAHDTAISSHPRHLLPLEPAGAANPLPVSSLSLLLLPPPPLSPSTSLSPPPTHTTQHTPHTHNHTTTQPSNHQPPTIQPFSHPTSHPSIHPAAHLTPHPPPPLPLPHLTRIKEVCSGRNS